MNASNAVFQFASQQREQTGQPIFDVVKFEQFLTLWQIEIQIGRDQIRKLARLLAVQSGNLHLV